MPAGMMNIFILAMIVMCVYSLDKFRFTWFYDYPYFYSNWASVDKIPLIKYLPLNSKKTSIVLWLYLTNTIGSLLIN